MKKILYSIAIVISLATFLLGSGRAAAAPTFTQYPIPSPVADPLHIINGPDGALWFTEGRSNQIGRIATSGNITEFPLPNLGSPGIPKVDGITLGPDGALWFALPQDHAVGRMTTSGQVTMHQFSGLGADNITTGPDGALWFTAVNRIGRVTTSGSFTFYPLPFSVLSVQITTGPDGALWFTGVDTLGVGRSVIGRITTLGVITIHEVSPNRVSLNDITTGPDGALWFTAINGNFVGRMTTDGAVTTYPLPNLSSEPRNITAGPDGAMWFTESSGNRIGRITTPGGVITEYPIPPSSGGPRSFADGITTGPDGAIWFTAPGSNQIGRLMPDPIDTTPPLVSGAPDRQPNSNGWYDNDVTITWTSADPTPSSGTPTQPPALVANQEGEHTYTSAQSCDPAGNCASGSIILKIDKTAPTISYTVTPAANATAWHSSDATVTFTCSDTTSGIDTCTSPITITDEGQNQQVIGTAIDMAGNTQTVTATINLDKTLPTISSSLNPLPNAQGWHNTDVAVTFTCDDSLSLIASCISSHSGPLSTEGANQVVTGTATDNADNSTSLQVAVNIDKTAPVLGMPVWVNNPKPTTGTATLTVPATENLSGMVQAEYFIGDTDPGLGNGTAMTLTDQQTSGSGAVISANLTASFGTALQTGVYEISFRVLDTAGNWSTVASDFLVVYNPTGPQDVAASKQIVPSSANGDSLPGMPDSQNNKAKLGFDVFYTTLGGVDLNSNLTLDYETGQACTSPQAFNCHTTNFTVNGTSPNFFNWLTLTGQNGSVGTFIGQGTLTIDGLVTYNPFRVIATDGGRTTPASQDSVVLYIFPVGANPNTAQPADALYQLHIDTNGNWVTIQ